MPDKERSFNYMRIIRITIRNDDCPKVVVSDKSKSSLLELWSKAKGAVTLYGKKVGRI